MNPLVKEKYEIEIDYQPVTVSVSYRWENDGIGAYECHGFRGFDAGINYPAIEEIIPVFTDCETQFREFVPACHYIQENWKRICEELTERIINESYDY
jgi:hypothetical protein